MEDDYMSVIEELSALLDEKKALFTEYEQCTNNLTQCDIDSIEDYITRRGQLANEIDKITAKINDQCNNAPNCAVLQGAINNTSNYTDIPQELKRLFSRGQEIFSIISQISAQEPQIRQRMKTQRAELIKKIKMAKNTPKISKYLNTIAVPVENGNLLDEKYDKA